MNIEPLAGQYLVAVYRGEIALKTANKKNIHDWAVETLDEIFDRYNKIGMDATENPLPTLAQSASSIVGMMPQRRDRQPKPKRRKRNYSLEYIEKVVETMGGRLNDERDGYVLPLSPSYEQALSAIKLLMKRAFDIQMIPKGVWFSVMIAMLLMFVISTSILLFFKKSFVEYALSGSFLLMALYFFFKWKSFPKFTKVAKEIRDIVYKAEQGVDYRENLSKVK